MSSLPLLLLLPLLFLGGIVAAAIIAAVRRRAGKTWRPIYWLLPLALPALALLGFAGLGAVGALVRSSDRAIYAEIFGEATRLREDQMLSDDFGSGAQREIFLRIEPTEEERRKLLSLPGIRQSGLTSRDLHMRAAHHRFSWWHSANPNDFRYCEDIRVLEAPSFNGWRELLIGECVHGGEGDGVYQTGILYIVAIGRA